VAGFCEYRDEPLGSGATELVSIIEIYSHQAHVQRKVAFLELGPSNIHIQKEYQSYLNYYNISFYYICIIRKKQLKGAAEFRVIQVLPDAR
jgi:hypothetical protein